MTVIIFLIVLAILIFVHELGHFLVAKACGIRVDAFALGFGPKLISKKVGEVTYSLNLIPFGGYVRIFGENPDDESISGPDVARSFVHKPKWQQIAVLFAGIFFNFVFAWLLIVIAFFSGVPASTDSYPEYRDRMNDEHIVITFVNKGSPAEKAGLKAGDTIVASSVEEIQNNINQSVGKGVEITYERNDVESKTNILAEQGIVEGKYAIGIAMDDVATLKLPIHLSILESSKFTIHMIGATFTGLYDLVAGMFKGTSSLESVTGPVGIAGLIGDAAKLGFTYLLMFTAIISINLGVLNLMPFPALDGGRILFVIIEAIIGRPIKPVIANTLNAIGFSLLILLMVVVTYRDIAKLFVK
ncbi:MAG: metalloprotease RseP [Patescibacteria group bacterium]|nr:metalloprotease RseP [Patescibacteria group bacterium]